MAIIDLIHPHPEELPRKWAHIIAETKHISTWDTVLELSWLAEYATRITHLLEIGSFDGRSAKVMLLANPKLTMVSLDTWDDGNLPVYQHNLGPEIAAGRVSFIQGESQKTIDQVDPYFDGCFVDGGHLEHLVIADIKGVIPLMKAGSLIAGHDFRTENGAPNDVGRGVRAVLGDKWKNPTDSIWCYQMP